MEENFVKKTLGLQHKIDKLTNGLNKCTLELKNTKDELDHTKQDAKNTIMKLTKENNDMKIEREKYNSSMNKNNEKINNKLKGTISDLEKRLEEKEAKHQNDRDRGNYCF